MDSWFGRHKSTDVMKQGTQNEDFIMQRFSREPWVYDVFQVGMLQSKRGGGWLAVSPDGIAVGHISSPCGFYQEEDDQVMFIEMKTRQRPNTIQQARTARRKHGRLVYCSYGSETFNDCVFEENRKMLYEKWRMCLKTFAFSLK
eukprot:scaffold68869_cov96-Cyclotella_meneghiniana.AAC.2